MLHDEIHRVVSQYSVKGKEPLTRAGAALFAKITTEKPVGFYFDETVKDALSLQHTAREFSKNGLLNLPFESCVFHLDKFYVENPLILLVTKASEDEIIAIDAGMVNGNIGIAGGGCYLNQKTGVSKVFKIVDKWAPEKEKLELRFRISLTMSLICMMLLNHPVYEKIEHDPDSALQRARVKRGKETLSKYVYINMKPHIKAALAAGDGSVRAPHWRRGHVRRLGDGRVVPVQACLVNWEGDPTDPAAPAKKVYVV